jgi:ribosomal protein L40E
VTSWIVPHVNDKGDLRNHTKPHQDICAEARARIIIMFCPNCGSENPSEVKFCRRCGTGLAVVAEALTHKAGVPTSLDQQVSKLVKGYYSGRHQLMLGVLSITAGLAALGLILALGKWVFFWIFLWVFMGLFGNGVRQFNKGWSDWSNASSELKALGFDKPPIGAARLPETTAYVAPQIPDDSASQIERPPSVTESTTRLLDPEKE